MHVSSLAHSLAVSDVIVNYLILLWHLLITRLVLWVLDIHHRNNTASSICQSLSLGNTFPGVWLSIRAETVIVFTCGPSSIFRLMPYKPNKLSFTCSFSPFLQLSYIVPVRNGLLALYWQCNSMIQTKNPSLSTFSFFLKLRSIYCAAEVAPTKGKNM